MSHPIRTFLPSRFALTAALTLALAASAFASDASDAFRQAKEMHSAWKKEKDEAKKAELQAQLDSYCKQKVEVLGASKLTRLDTMYFGQLQGIAGLKNEAIATLRAAVASKEETQYASVIHANLVQAIIDAGDLDAAFAELKVMKGLYDTAKETKVASMNVGMALRGALKFEASCEALRMALDLNEFAAVKPLCNGLLLSGQKEKAVATAKEAIEKAPAQMREDLTLHAAMVERVGTPAPALAFDAFVPAGEPDLAERIVVLGFWNVSAKTMKWTFKLLDRIKQGYGDDVVCLAATTYYKKNAETGKLEEGMAPEVERGFGSQLRDQEGYGGRLAYLKDEAAVKEFGLSALPHFVVIGKDRTLLFAHTMNPADGTDTAILKSVLDKALGK